MDDKEYTEYQEIVNTKLSENIDPDCEEFYFAGLEAKANNCDKYRQALNEIKDFIQIKREEREKETGNKQDWLYIKDKDILQIIDKVLGESL